MYDVAISWKAVYQFINNINIISMLLTISEQDYSCFFWPSLAFIFCFFFIVETMPFIIIKSNNKRMYKVISTILALFST